MNRVVLSLLILIFPICTFASTPANHYYYEKDYQKKWCDKHFGTMEVILSDKARVDCVTSTHAIEFDFAKKWAESVGQALYYAEKLKKKAGIVLIIENKAKEQVYIERLKAVTQKHGIDLWLMYPEDMKK